MVKFRFGDFKIEISDYINYKTQVHEIKLYKGDEFLEECKVRNKLNDMFKDNYKTMCLKIVKKHIIYYEKFLYEDYKIKNNVKKLSDDKKNSIKMRSYRYLVLVKLYNTISKNKDF